MVLGLRVQLESSEDSLAGLTESFSEIYEVHWSRLQSYKRNPMTC